jgi:hypothetical protein
MNIEEIEQRIRKEDKSGLGYIIGLFDFHHPYHIYWNETLKKDLLRVVLEKKDNWYKLKQFNTYKDLF